MGRRPHRPEAYIGWAPGLHIALAGWQTSRTRHGPRQDEKEKFKNKNEKYIHGLFFKYNAPKKYFEKYIESEAYGVLLKKIAQSRQK